MCSTISISNPKYFRPFDNTDNPCCWQVDAVCADIERVLESHAIAFEELSDDWGTGYRWLNADGVEHSMTVTCTDVDHVMFTIEYFATRRIWFVFRRVANNASTDFAALVPDLLALNDGDEDAVGPKSAT